MLKTTGLFFVTKLTDNVVVVFGRITNDVDVFVVTDCCMVVEFAGGLAATLTRLVRALSCVANFHVDNKPVY